MRKLIAAALLLATLTAAPATALETAAVSGRWGCVALDALGGLCLSSPFEGLGL